MGQEQRDPSHSTHTQAHPEENESDPRVSGWDEEGQRRNENKLCHL